MSRAVSPSTNRRYGAQRTCETYEALRASLHRLRKQLELPFAPVPKRRGPRTAYSDAELTAEIRVVLGEAPFTGEGHRKVWARLRLDERHRRGRDLRSLRPPLRRLASVALAELPLAPRQRLRRYAYFCCELGRAQPAILPPLDSLRPRFPIGSFHVSGPNEYASRSPPSGTCFAERILRTFERGDPVLIAHGFQRWLDALVDAGHSVAVRWIANPFLEAYRELMDRFPGLWVLEPSFPQYLRDFIAALEGGDTESAITLTRAYYQRVDRSFMPALALVMGQKKSAPAASDEPPEDQRH